jgi:putative flippase GtrA
VPLIATLRDRLSVVQREGLKFLAIGGAGYVTDVTVFNVLRLGLLHEKPLTAKVISTVVATLVTYAGNRVWTFRHRERSGFAREYVLFFLLNGIGMLITVATLAVSHYVLGFTSPLADNIAGNVVGIALGTLFRFWSYRRWVFREVPAEPAGPAAGPAGGAPGTGIRTTDTGP